ncbi:MAG: hypothetical protein ACFHWZ_14590 [Phycisphaerales bacterium]
MITAALVDGAHLPMLGAEMKLGESASPDARRALRDRYAVRFGLPQVGDGRLFVAEWAGFAEEQLDSSIAQADRDALDAAVRAAFLNASAALWLDSNEDAARANLADVRNGLSGFVASAGGPVSFGAQRTPRADGEWAARYLRKTERRRPYATPVRTREHRRPGRRCGCGRPRRSSELLDADRGAPSSPADRGHLQRET